MIGFILGGFVKKLEKLVKELQKDIKKDIYDLFDDRINPLIRNIDYIAQERVNHAITKVEILETKTKADIEYLLDNADNKIKHYLQTIDNIRKEAINETLTTTNYYLENRINQITLCVMEAVSLSQSTVENSLQRIEALENAVFQDATQVINKLSELIDGKLELIRNEFKRYLIHYLPNPFDKCRQKLKLGLKSGGLLSDVELYELTQCYELSKLNENTDIDQVLKVYGQLQQNALMMAALVSKSPELKNRSIKDWLKYGLLCEFWHSVINTYEPTNNLMLNPNSKNLMLPTNLPN
ncbi:hypothetical protein ACWATR_38375 [Nostoc sp. UIC 10890]